MFANRLGRRGTMIAAMTLSLFVIPMWAFGTTPAILTVGAFLMQAGVQGAWGMIPVYLTEMSGDATRGLVSGLAYQLGVLFGAPAPRLEFMLRDWIGYQWALASFEIMTILALIVILLLGRERRGRSFMKQPDSQPFVHFEQ